MKFHNGACKAFVELGMIYCCISSYKSSVVLALVLKTLSFRDTPKENNTCLMFVTVQFKTGDKVFD
jgi:hypothetical protein